MVFAAGSLLAIVTITALAAVAVYRIYYTHILQHAEINAGNLSEAIFDQERALLTGGTAAGARTLDVKPDAIPILDARMRRYLRPLEMVKIKVFGADGRIVYSTDRAIIGKRDSENGRLGLALAGFRDSKLETKDRVWDLEGEERVDLDLVETYLPIRDGDRVIGAFETYTDVTWSRDQVASVLKLTIGVVFGILVLVFAFLFGLMRTATRRVVRAERNLEAMAITDGLTGLANHRHLMSRAAEECARIPRHLERGTAKPAVGFVMIDLDHFKTINDAHGHLVGDEVLRSVADRIRAATRRYDIVGRFGGEEFLVVVPNTDEEETRRVAERVWDVVRAEPVRAAVGPVAVTASVGYSCALDEDVNGAIKRADDALYRAKHEGRDRVVTV